MQLLLAMEQGGAGGSDPGRVRSPDPSA